MHQAVNTARLVSKAGKALISTLDKDRGHSRESKESKEGQSTSPQPPIIDDKITTKASTGSLSAQAQVEADVPDLQQKLEAYVHHGKQISLLIVIGLACFALGKLGGGLFSLSLCAICIIIVSNLYLARDASHKKRTAWFIERKIQKQKLTDHNTETCEWLNNMLAKLWPVLEPFISTTVQGVINDQLEMYCPSFLDSLKLSEFTLGSNPPCVRSISTHLNTLEEEVISMEWGLLFHPLNFEDLSKKQRTLATASKIILAARMGKGSLGVDIPVQVTGCALEGNLKIELHTMHSLPFIRTAYISFTQSPMIGFNLKPLNSMDLMDVPGLSSFLIDLINSILESVLVEPNRLPIELDSIINGETILDDSVVMVLQATLNEARNLKSPATMPSYYVTYHLPAVEAMQGLANISKASTVKKSNQPYWSENSYHLINARGMLSGIEIRLWENSTGKEKMVGSCIMDQSKWDGQEHWARLKSHGKPKGEISVQLERLPLLAPTEDANSGVVRLQIFSAKDLDTAGKDPHYLSAYVKVYQGDNLILKSKVKKNTTSPSWNIGVDIPVFEIKSAGILTLQVFDNRLTGEYLCGECRIDVTGWKDALTPTWQGLKNEKNEFAGQVKYSLKFMSANMVPALSQTARNIGILRIRIVEGQDIRNVEVASKSDPFVKLITAGRLRARTHVIENNLNPVWNEVVYVLVRSLRDTVTLQVWDWNAVHKDRLIGFCQLLAKDTLKGAEEDPNVDFWKELSGEGMKLKANKGRLHFVGSYHAAKPLEIAAASEADSADAIETALDNQNSGICTFTIHEAILPAKMVSGAPMKFELISLIRSSLLPPSLDAAEKKTKSSASASADVSAANSPMHETIFSSPEVTPNIERPATNASSSSKIQDASIVWGASTEFVILDLEMASIELNILEARNNLLGENLPSWTNTKIKCGTVLKLYEIVKRSQNKSIWMDFPDFGKVRLSCEYKPVDLADVLASDQLVAEDAGYLTLDIVSARELPRVDSSGSSDPYVVVRVNDMKRYKTKIIKKNAVHPCWNEKVTLVITSKAVAQISFQVYDWNALSEHKSLGLATISCASLANDETKDHKIGLTDSASDSIIHVRTKFHPDPKARFTNKTRIKLDPLNMGKAVIGGIGNAGMLSVKTVGQGLTSLKTLGRVEEQVSGIFEELYTPAETRDRKSSISRSSTRNGSIVASTSYQDSLREDAFSSKLGLSTNSGQPGQVVIHITQISGLKRLDTHKEIQVKLRHDKDTLYKFVIPSNSIKNSDSITMDQQVIVPVDGQPYGLSIVIQTKGLVRKTLWGWHANLWDIVHPSMAGTPIAHQTTEASVGTNDLQFHLSLLYTLKT